MNPTAIIAGAAAGAALAGLHLQASWRASQRATATTGTIPRALLGLPVRVGLPAAGLFGLALWSPAALLAGALAFGLVERVALRRLAREEGA